MQGMLHDNKPEISPSFERIALTMARHLVSQLLADLDAGRSDQTDFNRIFVSANAAMWPSFYSPRRAKQLEAYVRSSLTCYLAGGLDTPRICVSLAILLDMAASRDGRLSNLLSAAWFLSREDMPPKSGDTDV